MIGRILVLWVLGIFLIVPYSVHRLVTDARPGEYALLIVVPLFWIFGFWGVVGPLLAAARMQRLARALEGATGSEEVIEAFRNNEGEEVIVDLIASDTRLPRFLSRFMYRRLMARLARRYASSGGDPADPMRRLAEAYILRREAERRDADRDG